MRWSCLHSLGKLIAVLLTATSVTCAAEPRPNIVIVLADDMGYGDPGCNNADSKIPTPHIDQLARQGMRFTDAHSPAGWCTPSRYGLLTGRYPWRSRRELDGGRIEPDRLTLAALLSQHGYHTACIGKWHLGFAQSAVNRDFSQPFAGGPRAFGFDYFFGMHASLDIPPYYWIEDEKCVLAPTEMTDDHHSPGVTPIQGAFWRGGGMAPGFKHELVLQEITDRAIGFLEEHQADDSDQPFFLYVPLTAPHTPWLPQPTFHRRSGAGDYGDFTAQVDATLGRVLAALQRLAIADNTLVIFSSDNGPVWYPQDIAEYGHRSTGPLRGMKIDLWEGAHRVPMIVRWPGITPAGTTCDQLVCFTDWMATVASVLQTELPPGAAEDSLNLLPLIQGRAGDKPIRDSLVIEGRMIRQGPWKLIEGNPNGGLSRFALPQVVRPDDNVLLFNLNDDLGETKNVAADNPAKVRELSALLAAERER